MTTPRVIGAAQRETPTDELTATAARRRRRLPDDLLRQASKRLQILTLIAAALWFLGPLLGHLAIHFADTGDGTEGAFQVIDGIAAFAFATSIGLYLYLRTTRRDPAFLLDLGLVYLVFTAIALGLMIHWAPVATAPVVPRPTITWIGPVILMTAAIVPAEPWKMLLAGFLAASMDPLGMLLGRAFGAYHFDSVLDALAMHYPNYLLLGVAVVISGVLTRLGQQVTRARELGSYRLGDLIGRGGMGEVYFAHHRMLARPAAIKLIRPEALAGEDGTQAQLATARFRREAEAAARLKSPHSVQLYDFGVTDEGRLYLVMELLDGMNLEQLVRRDGALPAARVAHILRQVCDSLQEAHDAGLVHRDIKPANIHVGRVGRRDDFVKVLDFGLVKSLAGAGGDDSMASVAGMALGTPAFMAPEMVHNEAVDGRADLYSLGCVAYYLLTGHLVFEGETAIQTILMHLQQDPVPPSIRTDRPIPPGLERLVLSCLAKRADDRPQSAETLAVALAAFDERRAES
ncbi:MAG TPA: serine/threonine-protein kinase [Gemmatimonadales bacterium]|nr:serine/threonine-protein kinase [Gemmatimonadales bacterium]